MAWSTWTPSRQASRRAARARSYPCKWRPTPEALGGARSGSSRGWRRRLQGDDHRIVVRSQLGAAFDADGAPARAGVGMVDGQDRKWGNHPNLVVVPGRPGEQPAGAPLQSEQPVLAPERERPGRGVE